MSNEQLLQSIAANRDEITWPGDGMFIEMLCLSHQVRHQASKYEEYQSRAHVWNFISSKRIVALESILANKNVKLDTRKG
jgi:hypothetical protein